MTRLGRVCWINKDKRDTRRFSLVRHKLPQLVEAPTVVAIPVRLADLRPSSDARQIFEGNLPMARITRLADQPKRARTSLYAACWTFTLLLE
jgi:hypothetical protein